MLLRSWLSTSLLPIAPLVTVAVSMISGATIAQEASLQKLGGTWLFVEDRTEGRAVEDQGPPMNVQFTLRIEKDAVIYPRPGGDERITLDGSSIEKKSNNGSINRSRGEWKDGVLEYTQETVRLSDNKRVFLLRRVFQAVENGLLVTVTLNEGEKQVAFYKHPEDIALPKPAQAKIKDLAWLADTWSGERRTSSIEESWSLPKGNAMLGTSSTVRGDKMVAFEFLRIVERDGGLVYVAQPGGRPPTEFVLIKLNNKHAEFVNPRHDYPQRIVYELSSEGVLTTSIGFAKGRLQGMEFKREDK